MKSHRSLKAALRLLGLLGALSAASLARADLSYLVDINTAPLVGNLAGPFYLDFQSLFGSGSAQTITLSNFNLTGGSFLAGTEFATGAVTGNLATSLVLNPNAGSFYNEFFQQFAPTVTNISFNLTVTTNGAGVTPTSFSMSILDNALVNITTTGLGNSLVFFSLNGGLTTAETAVGTGEFAGVTAAIPEPATYAVLTAVAALAYAMRRRMASEMA